MLDNAVGHCVNRGTQVDCLVQRVRSAICVIEGHKSIAHYSITGSSFCCFSCHFPFLAQAPSLAPSLTFRAIARLELECSLSLQWHGVVAVARSCLCNSAGITWQADARPVVRYEFTTFGVSWTWACPSCHRYWRIGSTLYHASSSWDAVQSCSQYRSAMRVPILRQRCSHAMGSSNSSFRIVSRQQLRHCTTASGSHRTVSRWHNCAAT